MIYSRERLVNGCDETARTEYIHDQNPLKEPSVEVTFDLERAHVPKSTLPIGNEFAFMEGHRVVRVVFFPLTSL